MVKSVVAQIEANYERLSPTDRTIANFFVNNREVVDFSAVAMSARLFVSKSALSRFAQRIGFQGYRDFMSVYRPELVGRIETHHFNTLTQTVMYTYNQLQDKAYALIDEAQISRVVEMIDSARKVYVYGYGNSGLAANEFKMRFMRLGLDVEALTDDHLMKMNNVLIKPDSLLVALSISSYSMVDHIRAAKARNGAVVLLTTRSLAELDGTVDETVLCPSAKHLDVGNVISPQFPLLLLIDVIYAFYLARGTDYKEGLLQDTLVYIQNRKEGELTN